MKSQFKINQPVVLEFFNNHEIANCKIGGVKFTDYGKVLYDVIIVNPDASSVNTDEEQTIIRDVDSVFVKEPIDEYSTNDLLNDTKQTM